MKKNILNASTFFLIILSIISFNSELRSQNFLKAQGKKIVNSNGEEVYLKGMGLGGWLLEEGYMLQMSGFANSPTEIRSKIEGLIGKENTDEFYKIYHANYVKEKDIKKLKEWGFNSIRLPMHYKWLTPKDQPGIYLEEGFQTIDSLLSWCKKNEIYLILDLHAAPGAQSRDNISDSDGEARLWTDPANQTRTVELWKTIAARYKDEEWIGGYDLINETAYDLGPVNQALRDLYIRITNAIREVDNNHIVFIEGNWYATDFNGLTPPWDNNMVYSFHKYWNETNTSSIGYLLNIRNQYNVPLWLGETGENSNQWFAENIELMAQNNIGWAWWPHKKIGSISAPLNVPVTPDYQKLLDYWSGRAAKPTVEFAKNALFTIAQNLDIDKCEFHKDVIDALFRQPDNTQTIPFSENNVPGIIYGTNYDMGKTGFAYQDTRSRNVDGHGGEAYNNGWAYRNDGVDIEKCSDFKTNGYNIGWTETGEWLQYTINIPESGNYKIHLRVAAQNSGGKILLRLNGTQLGDYVDVPATGGWQSWQTILAGNFDLPQGEHKLKIQFFFGGFNFNFAEFIANGTSSVNDEQTVRTFSLEQNYPNPFNPVTKIKYQIPEAANVNLKVFNILGKEVAVLAKSFQSAGKYEVEFDATDLSNGIYFYQIKAGKFNHIKKMVLLK